MSKLNFNEYMQELEALVNIDSGSNDPEGVNRVADFFEKRFKAAGFNIERFSGAGMGIGDCLVITNKPDAVRYDVLFVGHMDTVFSKGTAAARPFSSDGVNAYGPGVADMKNGILMIYHLLKELEVLDHLSICAILNPDEEIGSVFSTSIIVERAKRSDYAFVMESASASGAHCIQRKGKVTFLLNFTGIAAHSGYIFDTPGASAITELSHYVLALNELADRQKGTSVNVGIVQGGTAVNVVPAHASLNVEFRMWNESEKQRIKQTLSELISHPFNPDVRVEMVDLSRRQAPMEPSPATLAYVEKVKQIAEGIGLTFEVKPRGGLSDANDISEHTAVCIDALGPRGDLDHGLDEYMILSSADECFALMTAMLTDIAGGR